MRSFGIVEDKIAEADFFLYKIEECKFDFFAAQCYLSAFLSSARSVTFAIQASIGDIEGFDEWYKQAQVILKKDELAKYFLKCRNESIHIGISHIRSGEVVDGTQLFYFQNLFEQDDNVPQDDVLTSCKKYMTSLTELVYKCFEKFGYEIDPDMYYTTQNLGRNNKEIEDFEVELGLPKGWTYVEGFGNEKRLRLLRDQFPVLEIDLIFEKYLNKTRLEILKRERIA